MKTAITREQAYALLRKYNQDPFHLRHGRTVEEVMRHFARELGYGEEEEFWGIVGLLHDLDFEMYPEQHCIKSQELMREAGLEEELIHATASHGYGQVCDIYTYIYYGEGAVCLRRADRADLGGGSDAPVQEHPGYGAEIAEEKV